MGRGFVEKHSPVASKLKTATSFRNCAARRADSDGGGSVVGVESIRTWPAALNTRGRWRPALGQRGSISPALFAEDSTDYRPSSPPPGPPCSRIQAVALPPCRSRVDRCTDGRIASKYSLAPRLSLPPSFTSLPSSSEGKPRLLFLLCKHILCQHPYAFPRLFSF